MLTARYLEKEKLGLEELETPKPKCGEALVKVSYAGICGSDMHVFHGNHPTAKFPITPGHELVGTLASLGENTHSKIKIGSKVAVQPYTSCGICEACITGNDNVCESLQVLGVHRDGCFAEYAICDAKKVYALPDDIDMRIASLTEPLAVGVHDVHRSGLKVGDKVLIIGGGPIGIMIALVANLAGADVYISELDRFRLDFISELGFGALNPLDKSFDSEVDEITFGKKFDIVYEVSGSKQGILSSTSLAKPEGTVMVVGMATEAYPVNITEIFLKQLKFKGVRIHSQKSFAVAVSIISKGILNDKLVKLISKEYALKDIENAYSYIGHNKDYFKIVLKV
jgi:2-desacetyl-2-hydroxyethyl bacteriochlorophyllide A dehydrogenase